MPLLFTLDSLIEGEGNWILYTKLGRLDVMQWVKGIDSYEELRASAERVEIPEIGNEILIAGFDDLITMKQEAGRDQDRMDIVRLRMARGLEE
jgi:hypothetical protein